MKLTKAQLKAIIKEEIDSFREQQDEGDESKWEKVAIPAQVKRYMNRFLDKIKGANLTRRRQISILYKIVDGLGLSPRELMRYTQRVKRDI